VGCGGMLRFLRGLVGSVLRWREAGIFGGNQELARLVSERRGRRIEVKKEKEMRRNDEARWITVHCLTSQGILTPNTISTPNA